MFRKKASHRFSDTGHAEALMKHMGINESLDWIDVLLSNFIESFKTYRATRQIIRLYELRIILAQMDIIAKELIDREEKNSL